MDFIQDEIDSLLQLEALLFVYEAGSRTRSAPQLAVEMYVPAPAIAGWLDGFAARGLCEAVDGGYRVSDSEEVYGLLADVADCYLRRRISLTRLIFSPRPKDPRTSFSDAFRIRRDG